MRPFNVENRKKYEKIHALVTAGETTVTEACEKFGIKNKSNYYGWKNNHVTPEKAPKTKVHIYEGKKTKRPVGRPEGIFFTPAQVTQLLKAALNA